MQTEPVTISDDDWVSLQELAENLKLEVRGLVEDDATIRLHHLDSTIYEGVGHQQTDEMISDVLDFFREQL